MTLTVNGAPRELATGTTLADLVGELAPQAHQRGVAAAVNDTVVPRSEWAGWALTADDRVEVLTAVQGG
jgi:sulfur carrier protein